MKHEDEHIDYDNCIAPWLGKTIKIVDYYLQEALSKSGLDLTKEQMILDPISSTIEDSKVNQIQWHINNTFRLSNKLQANMFFSYLSQKLNYISINTSKVPVKYSRIKQGKSSNLLLEPFIIFTLFLLFIFYPLITIFM